MPAAGGIQILNQLRAEGHQSAIGVAFRVQQPIKSIADADHLPSHFARRHGSAHDHGIDSRDKAGTHMDGNASQETAMTYFMYAFYRHLFLLIQCLSKTSGTAWRVATPYRFC